MARNPPPSPRLRTVRLAKWLLPLGSLAVLATIFLSGTERGVTSDLLTTEERARLGAGLRLDNPRFAGRTEAGEPFVLSAAAALPDGPMPDEVRLDRPRGQVTLGDGRVVEAEAETGLLRRSADDLTLEGAVRIATDDGYVFTADTLSLDLASKGAATPGAVVATGPRGRLEAGRMRLEGAEARGDGLVAVFEGGVRVLFRPGEAD
ncbi:MAG: LPS export ABC transporter periplasmic protein LptC [Paracoccaceae bacterium]